VWAVTRSPYALLFAALGPVVAVAGVADQRVSGRRAARRASRERIAGLQRLHAEVLARRAAVHAALRARAPSAREILDGRANPALLWRAEPGAETTSPVLSVGSGVVPSGLSWRGEPDARVPTSVAVPTPGSSSRGRPRPPRRRALPLGRRRSSTGASDRRAPDGTAPTWAELVTWIPDAPVLVSSAGGLGLRGPAGLVAPVLRAAVVQLVHALPPDDLRVLDRPSGAEWDWLARLPHAVDLGVPASPGAPAVVADGIAIRLRIGAQETVLAASTRVESLPAACRTVLDVRGPGTARILAADPAPGLAAVPDPAAAPPAAAAVVMDVAAAAPPGERDRRSATDAAATDLGAGRLATSALARADRVRPELVSLREAERFADELAALARRRGLDAARAPLPLRVPFAELTAPVHDATAGPRAGSLAAPLGVGHDGPVVVDLVADGPHAVVAGTTGSGKSELLVTWMAALAAAHPPEEVTVLLVDFKGGAAFDPLLVLPHAVGLVTDLDGQGARRALESLRAEIRHRERILREAGASGMRAAAMRARS
jgi:S-DNA-T family DNA segregation ATPase FtsK/SpoIIIE